MTAPRLTYFDMRGRAEAIRLFLCATQTDMAMRYHEFIVHF